MSQVSPYINFNDRLEEINHVSFFLCEMDKYNYQIPRKILEDFLELNVTKDTLQRKLNEQSK
jgi:hypothetical protein